MFNKYPYTDFHELNLDWFLKQFKELVADWEDFHTTISAEWAAVQQEWTDTEAAWQTLYNYVHDYFDNLDVQEEIDHKLDEMVADGTMIALIAPYLPFITPEMFGAVGDGVTDDTNALKSCFSTGNKLIICQPNKTYKITAPVEIEEKTNIDLNNATILSTYKHAFYNFDPDDTTTGYNGNGQIIIKNGVIIGGSINLIHGSDILIDNVQILNCLNDHLIELCACKNVKILNSYFSGSSAANAEYINLDPCYIDNFPWCNDPATLDGTPLDNITIDKCTFTPGSDSYTVAHTAIGVHSIGSVNGVTVDPALTTNHSNIRILNCYIEGFTDYGVRINCINKAVITGNTFKMGNYPVQFGSWKACEDLTFTNNTFMSTNATSEAYSYLIRTAGANRVSIYGNAYNNVGGGTAKQIRMNLPGAPTVLTFGELERNHYTPAGLDNFDITAFNRMEISLGTIAGGTYGTYVVPAYYTRNFRVGEAFPVIYNDNGTPAVATVTITDAHTVTCDKTIVALTLYRIDMPSAQ